MQLDKTRIAIRERGMFDLLDLSLRVIHGHAGALVGYWLLGALPFAILNHWLLAGHWFVEDGSVPLPLGYLWNMTLLMTWELPLATAPLTLYLGKALFLEQPTLPQIAGALASRWGQIVVFCVLGRGMFLFWPIWAYLADGPAGLVVALGFLAVLGWGFGCFFWPYFNEVLLLEGNPFWGRKDAISTLRRVTGLHGHAAGEVFLRSLIALLVGACLFLSLWSALDTLHGMAMLDRNTSAEVTVFYAHVAAWLVLGFFTVVRFLSYLDLRIRIEGWEMELLLRAEGARIARQLA